MHALYNHIPEFDEYAGQRAAQAFSLSHFVKHTSTSCDGVIITGDFNSTPTELAYRVIRSNAVVKDAWLVKVSAQWLWDRDLPFSDKK
jgi:sphingomyelin phosphodiesterase 2